MIWAGIIVGLSLGVCEAQTKLIFYPERMTLVNQIFKKIPVKQNSILLSKLPFGIVSESIHIFSPPLLYWHYQFDEEAHDAALRHAVGKTVQYRKENRIETAEWIQKEGNDVLLLKDNTVFWVPKDTVLVPYNPDMALSPRLLLKLPYLRKPEQDISMSFFLSTLSSSILYKAFYDESEKTLQFQGYLQIKNNSGYAFQDASMEVLIGEPQFVTSKPSFQEKGMLRAMATSTDEPFLKEMNEYFTFFVPGEYTLPPYGVTEKPLFSEKKLSVSPIFRYSSERVGIAQEETFEEPADLFLKFNNTTGFPLPRGICKVFDKETFIGETWLSPTSRQQDRELRYGKSMDVKGRKWISQRKTVSKTEWEESYKVVIKNYKLNSVTIEYHDMLPPHGEILKASSAYETLPGRVVAFHVSVLPVQSHEMEYTVRFKQAAF